MGPYGYNDIERETVLVAIKQDLDRSSPSYPIFHRAIFQVLLSILSVLLSIDAKLDRTMSAPPPNPP